MTVISHTTGTQRHFRSLSGPSPAQQLTIHTNYTGELVIGADLALLGEACLIFNFFQL